MKLDFDERDLIEILRQMWAIRKYPKLDTKLSVSVQSIKARITLKALCTSVLFWKLLSSWETENEKLCRAGYHENSKNGILWCDSISYFIGLLWYNLTYQEQSVWCALDVLQRKLETRAIFRNKLYLENFICKAILAGKARHHSTMTHECDLFRNSKQKSSVHVCSAIKWEIKNARL